MWRKQRHGDLGGAVSALWLHLMHGGLPGNHLDLLSRGRYRLAVTRSFSPLPFSLAHHGYLASWSPLAPCHSAGAGLSAGAPPGQRHHRAGGTCGHQRLPHGAQRGASAGGTRGIIGKSCGHAAGTAATAAGEAELAQLPPAGQKGRNWRSCSVGDWSEEQVLLRLQEHPGVQSAVPAA